VSWNFCREEQRRAEQRKNGNEKTATKKRQRKNGNEKTATKKRQRKNGNEKTATKKPRYLREANSGAGTEKRPNDIVEDIA
jgi:hypothetical protein